MLVIFSIQEGTPIWQGFEDQLFWSWKLICKEEKVIVHLVLLGSLMGIVIVVGWISLYKFGRDVGNFSGGFWAGPGSFFTNS